MLTVLTLDSRSLVSNDFSFFCNLPFSLFNLLTSLFRLAISAVIKYEPALEILFDLILYILSTIFQL